MTVKELIEQLTELDPELHVFVNGYEGGYHYADISEPKNISLNWNTEWYYGPHELTENIREEFRPNHEQVKGIVL
jgi:hypothetical protein